MNNETEGAVLAPKVVEPTMEVLRYKEELASKMGLPSPYAMGIMKELANDLVASGMVPKCWAGNPMAVYGAALRGREMGFQPMESVFEVFWAAPGGNLGMYAKKMLQVMHTGGVTSEFLREDAEACEILFTPPAPHKSYTAKFHVSEAKDAKLVKDDSNWMKWRTDMNRARAISRGWRALLGTFKGGSSGVYSKEEMEDTGMLGEISTTSEPTESDQKRAEVLDARYTVKLKTPAPDEPAAIEVKPEPPTPEAAKAPEPAPPSPEPAPIKYEIYSLFLVAGGGQPKSVLLPDEISTDKTAASLRAQAIANRTGQAHAVVQVDSDGSRHEVDRCLPPKPAPTEPAAKPAPAAQAPTPTAPPAPTGTPESNAAKSRLEALAVKLGIPGKTAMARFTAYMSGFIGCPLKQFKDAPLAERLVALESLEHLIEFDSNEFASGPEESGKRRRKYRDGIAEYLNNLWPKPDDAPTVALALKLAQQWGNSPQQFEKWLTMEGIALDFLVPMADVHALLRVLLKTREGVRLLPLNREHNMSIAAVIEQIETRALMCPVEKAASKSVENAIEAYLMAVKEAAKPKAKPQPEPEPEPIPEPAAAQPPAEEDNLFAGSDW